MILDILQPKWAGAAGEPTHVEYNQQTWMDESTLLGMNSKGLYHVAY